MSLGKRSEEGRCREGQSGRSTWDGLCRTALNPRDRHPRTRESTPFAACLIDAVF